MMSNLCHMQEDNCHRMPRNDVILNEEITIKDESECNTAEMGYEEEDEIIDIVFNNKDAPNSIAEFNSSFDVSFDASREDNMINEEMVRVSQNLKFGMFKNYFDQFSDGGKSHDYAEIPQDLSMANLMNASIMDEHHKQEQKLANDEVVLSNAVSSSSSLPLCFDSQVVRVRDGLSGHEMNGKGLHFVKYINRDGKQIKIWECGVCGKEFGHQYTLMRHLPTHTNERKFQCNICGKAFRQMSTLSQHRAIHSADRPYVCELCKKTFNRVSTLISHRKTHSGMKPHQCHLCHKAFHQKGNLRNHIFTHTNERPYKCDICQKGFNQMSNLMCHKMKAHQNNDRPKFPCTFCGKEFPKRISLRNHEENCHDITSHITANNNISFPLSNCNVPPIQTKVVQGENGEKMHILHIPDVATGVPLPTGAPTSARVRYTNGVLIDALRTRAMRQALEAQQRAGADGGPSPAPFALLKPIGAIPVLVRVLTAPHGKHMLVPATAEDLRAFGKITVTENESGANAEQIEPEPKEEVESTTSGNENDNRKTTTVQIKIPVVATVIQKFEPDGTMSMSVESPGPDTKQFINDTLANEPHEMDAKNMQFLSDGGTRMSIAIPQSSNTQVINFENETKYSSLDIGLDLTRNYNGAYDPNNSIAITPNDQRLQSNDIVYSEQLPMNSFEIMDDNKNPRSAAYPNDLFNESNLYNEENSLTLYSHSPTKKYNILE